MDVVNLQAQPLWIAIAIYLCAAAIVWAAGGRIAGYADQISKRTGIGGAVVGMILLAAATSLPELSTVIKAVKLHRSDMAIGDVLGGNMFDIMLILLVDALYRGAPVLTEVDQFAGFAGVLGIVLTSIYVIGMLERRDRTILRMGVRLARRVAALRRRCAFALPHGRLVRIVKFSFDIEMARDRH